MARKLDGNEPTEQQHAEPADPPGLTRRNYVKVGAALAATAGAGAAFSPVSATVNRAGIGFEQTRDAVADLGIDPTGERSLGRDIAAIPADTLVQFPTGTYRIDERIEFDVDGTIGFEAIGDATIKGGSGFTDFAFDVRSADAIYYAGFTHDETEGDVSHHWHSRDRVQVSDITYTETPSTCASAGGDDVVLSTSDAATFDTIVLDPGEQRTYEISDGEHFENILIDQTAAGAMFTILVEDEAEDWAIRNVGWKGIAPVDSGDRDHAFLINVRGTGVIENIFIDQRGHESDTAGSGVGAIWTYSEAHHGHIDCRHNFIAGCGNNACYDSGDGWEHYPGTGTVGHEYSYHRDNTPSNFRPGNPGSYVRHCVSIAHDPDGLRGGYPATGSQLTRACWAWHHEDITMEECAIWWDPDDVQPSSPFWATHRSASGGDECRLSVIDCDINDSWEAHGNDLIAEYGGTVEIDGLGTDPRIDILGDGVPVTPEMAARGERTLPPELGTAPGGGHGDASSTWAYADTTGTHTDLPYELVIEHTTPGERVTYEIEFDGAAEVGEWEHNATLDGSVATGGVGPSQGIDNIYFDGTIASISGDHLDHARILLADAQTRSVIREIDPDDCPCGQQSLRIIAAEPTANYEITVSGTLESDPDVAYNATDNISGGNAEGTVAYDPHGYLFDGEVVDAFVDGDATIVVDGEPIVDATGPLDRLIRIDGSIGTAVTRYACDVSGSIAERAADSGGMDGRWDQLESYYTEDSVTGIVETRVDAYRYSGSIVDVAIYGPAEITVERIP